MIDGGGDTMTIGARQCRLTVGRWPLPRCPGVVERSDQRVVRKAVVNGRQCVDGGSRS